MNDQSPFRLAMLGMLVLGLFASLFARLWYLQVVTEAEAQAQAEANLLRTVFVPAPRGRVLDRTGNVLIDNRLVNEVTLNRFALTEALPRESQRKQFAIKLAREVSAAGYLIKAADVEAAITDQKYGLFDEVPIATDVPERFSILIGEREDEFPGVGVRKTTVRFYPYGNLAAHLLGYVGPVFAEDLDLLEGHPKLYRATDEIGRSGVERGLEEVLRGTPGIEVIEVDAAGNPVQTVSATEPTPGNDVQLTLDINLQALAERELAEGIRFARTQREQGINSSGVAEELDFFKAPGGAMVLLDPDGARILAMASYPTYDQRIYLQERIPQRQIDLLNDPASGAPLLNRATNGSYAPGSTFKLITAYAALDSGMLGDRGFLGRSQYLVDNGIWRVPGECFGAGCSIENAGQKPLGDVDLAEAIAQSSNIYFGQLGFQFNVRQGFQARQLIRIANDFGFGEGTDAIPGALAGAVPEPANAGGAANLAVGQGDMIATPLQMANAYAAIANGGKLYSPMLAERTLDAATGEELLAFPERLRHELYMPDEFYNPMITGLAGVVASEKGTAFSAFEDFPLNRFQILGKTGTVENRPKQDNAAFAAFGPWPNPQYAAIVYIEQAGLGGDSAAPVVASVFRQIADGNIATVPTEAEADDLISVAEAEEEERLRTQQEADREERLAAAAAGVDGQSFEVLVPGEESDTADSEDPDTADSDDADTADSGSEPAGDNSNLPVAPPATVPTATPTPTAVAPDEAAPDPDATEQP